MKKLERFKDLETIFGQEYRRLFEELLKENPSFKAAMIAGDEEAMKVIKELMT